MASANTPVEFTSEQAATIGKLSLLMKVAAAVLLLLAAVYLVGGILTVLKVSSNGLLSIVEGVAIALLGLVLLSCSMDARFLKEGKYSSWHLTHVFQHLAVFYKTLLILAILLMATTGIRLFMG